MPPSKPTFNWVHYVLIGLIVLLLVLLAILLIIQLTRKSCNNWNTNDSSNSNQLGNEAQLPFAMSAADLANLGIDSSWTLMQDVDSNLLGPTSSSEIPTHDEAVSQQIVNEQLRDPTTAQVTKVKLRPVARGRGRRGPHQRAGSVSGVTEASGVKNASGSSLNWSGYAAATNMSRPANNSVTFVVSQWVVPSLMPESGHTYASYWPGMDGFSNSTVEQLGSEHDWVNGGQVNYVWFEMYPQYAYEITGFPCNPGDHMQASVTYLGRGQFRLVIQNLTHSIYYTVPASYTYSSRALCSSAEMIIEAPTVNGQVASLSNFGTAQVMNCSMTINGVTGTFSNSHWQNEQLTMVTRTNTARAVPSALTNAGANFTEQWRHV